MDPWAGSKKRPRGALPATGDLLAALVGVGEWPEGSVVAVGDTAGSLRGSCAVVVLPALPGSLCSTGQASECLKSTSSRGFCREQSSPSVFCCCRGVEKLQFHRWEPL